MNRVCAFRPQAENQGLALELAASPEDVTRILGDSNSAEGKQNRQTAIRFQHFDFVFIPFYVAFFSAAALINGRLSGALIVVGIALVTGIFDVVEDLEIIAMANGRRGSARRYGQLKWLFYFATVAAEGALFLWPPFRTIKIGLGALLLAMGLSGSMTILRGSLRGIIFAAKISMVALVGLALASLIRR